MSYDDVRKVVEDLANKHGWKVKNDDTNTSLISTITLPHKDIIIGKNSKPDTVFIVNRPSNNCNLVTTIDGVEMMTQPSTSLCAFVVPTAYTELVVSAIAAGKEKTLGAIIDNRQEKEFIQNPQMIDDYSPSKSTPLIDPDIPSELQKVADEVNGSVLSEPRPEGNNWRVRLPDGFVVDIIDYAIGLKDGQLEFAITKNGTICYNTNIESIQVCNNWEEVAAAVREISQAIKNGTLENKG